MLRIGSGYRFQFFATAALLVACAASAQHKRLAKPAVTLRTLQKTYVGRWFVVRDTDKFFIPSVGSVRDYAREKTLQLVAMTDGTSDASSRFPRNALGETSSTVSRSSVITLELTFLDPKTGRKFMWSCLPWVLETSTGVADIGTVLRLTTSKEEHAQKALKLIPTLVGKVLYADDETWAYGIESSIDALIADRENMRVRNTDLCCMRPLRITAAQYNEAEDAVILKIALPGGNSVLALSRYVDNDRIPLIDRVNGSFYGSIPASLSSIDARGLRSNSVIDGMTRIAVEMLLGSPVRENDYGKGGTQLVYSGGRKVIYLNSDDKVIDVHYLDF